MSLRRRSQCGNMSLMALASVTGGVMFAMVFANLVRYVSVENALEQATQKIARCIDPTDPECAVITAVPSHQTYDWFRPVKGTNVVTSADTYDYAANAYRGDYRLTFPAYELQKAPIPPIEYVNWQLPLRETYGELNPYERRSLHVRAVFDGIPNATFVPRNNPNFPEFDPNYEEEKKNLPPNQWSPRALTVRGDVRERNNQPVSRDINLIGLQEFSKSGINLNSAGSGNNVKDFVTPWYEVPLLESDGIAPTCTDNGAVCSTQYASGGGANQLWNERAHIAVKAFAQLQHVNGNPSVKWAGMGDAVPGTPDGWGLQVEVLEPSEWATLRNSNPNPAFARPDDTHGRICLGGRNWSEVNKSSEKKNFHLVLRGSIKRHTGDNSIDGDGEVDAACPGNDRSHWNLTVKRGGAYRIRGALKVSGGRVTADVRILSYVDEYTRVGYPAARAVCEKDLPLRNGETVSNNCLDYCREFVTSAHNQSAASCSIVPTTTPLCASEGNPAADPFVFPLGRISCGQAATYPACGAQASPIDLSSCSQAVASNPGRKICTESRSAGSISIPAQNFSCPDAQVSTQQVSCGDGRTEVVYRPDRSFGDVMSCPNVQPIAAAPLAASKISVNGGLVSVQPQTFNWSAPLPYSPAKWERAFDPKDEFGQPLVDPNSVRSIEASYTPVNPVYVRNDPNWLPPLEVFGLSTSDIENVRIRNNYLISKTGETPVPIANVYPFANKPEYEIPDFLPSSENAADCTGESASLEARMRAYAAAAVPEVSDSAVKFSFTQPEYRGSRNVVQEYGCGTDPASSLNVPACTKTLTSREEKFCSAAVYLGTFVSPDMPQICRGANAVCDSRVSSPDENTETEKPQLAAANLALASDKGFDEISRALPGARRGCAEPGCAEFSIDTIASLETRIVARYHMPLTFPLDIVLGRKSLAVEKVKQEIQELAIAGRANAGAPN